MILRVLKYISLTLTFLLELCALAALGYWGFQIGATMSTKIGLGIGAPLLAIVIWAIFGAPRSTRQLHGLGRWLLAVLFFGSAAVALFSVHQHISAEVFALVFVINWPISEIATQKDNGEVLKMLEKKRDKDVGGGGGI